MSSKVSLSEERVTVEEESEDGELRNEADGGNVHGA